MQTTIVRSGTQRLDLPLEEIKEESKEGQSDSQSELEPIRIVRDVETKDALA